MTVLDQEKCMSALSPHLAPVHGAMHRGFDRYLKDYLSEIKAEHSDRAVTSNVHSHMLAEMAQAFEGVSGAALLDVRGLKVLNLDDRIVGRFKKVDDQGRSRSYPTKQAKAFDLQLPLPGVPAAATRVTFGYEPDAAFSAIERIVVACPYGDGIPWCAQVNVVDSVASWIDITPQRLTGTTRFQMKK